MAPPFLQLSTIGSNDHRDLDSYHLFNYLEPQSSFSSTTTTTTSSLSSPLFLSPPQIHGHVSHHYYSEPQSFQFQLLEADHIVSYGGSYDHHDQALGDEKGDVINLSIDHPKHEGDDDHKDHENRSSHGENVTSVKWMSSKMRIMRKMANPDQTISSMHNNTTTTANTSRVNMSYNFEDQKVHQSLPMGAPDSSSNTNPVRVCSDCHTTKTPLWRSGPKGPKSLCNACGIRQRKARRAMAAAAAAANGTSLTVEAPSLIKTSKVKIKDNKTIPFKKRCHKLAITPSPKGKSKTTKIRFGDFSIGNNMDQMSGTVAPPPNTTTTATSTSFQRVFPQDEKEAAILLMALSCGLVRG